MAGGALAGGGLALAFIIAAAEVLDRSSVFGFARMSLQRAMCRSAGSGANLRMQCGHCTRSSIAATSLSSSLVSGLPGLPACAARRI